MCELVTGVAIGKVEHTVPVNSGDTHTFEKATTIRPRDQWWECRKPDGSFERISGLAPFMGLRVAAGETLRRIPAADRH